MIRCDRSVFTSVKQSYGGVLLAIRKDIKYSEISLISCSFKSICVKLSINDKDLIVVLSYIPLFYPSITADYHREFIECLSTSLGNYVSNIGFEDILILSDFNIPGYQWFNFSSAKAVGLHKNPEIRLASSIYSNLCFIYKLFQYNCFKNSSGNLLDLVFSNLPRVSVEISLKSLFECDSFHHPLDIVLPILTFNFLDENESILDFRNANYDFIIDQLIESKFFELEFNAETIYKKNFKYDF